MKNIKITSSISLQLLKKVFFIYFSITLAITLIQVCIEFYETKNIIKQELVILEKTFSAPLKEAIWDFDNAQLESITSSILTLSFVQEIVIADSSGNIISKTTKTDTKNIFSHRFDIFKEHDGKKVLLATVTVSSDQNSVVNMVKTGVYLLIVSAAIKSFLLWLLFLWAFRKYLIRPLDIFTEQIDNVDFERIGEQKISIETQKDNELYLLQDRFNTMIDKLQEQKNMTLKIKQEYVEKLEQEVRDRTLELENSNMQLKFMSTTDYLTNIRNARSFYDVGGQYFAMAKRNSKQLSILTLSLNDFNSLSAYGSQIADNALQLLVTNAKVYIQESDIFGRLGTNEFAIILFDTSPEDVRITAKRIAEVISSVHIKHDDKLIFLSVALGVSSMQQEDSKLDDVLSRATTLPPKGA